MIRKSVNNVRKKKKSWVFFLEFVSPHNTINSLTNCDKIPEEHKTLNRSATSFPLLCSVLCKSFSLREHAVRLCYGLSVAFHCHRYTFGMKRRPWASAEALYSLRTEKQFNSGWPLSRASRVYTRGTKAGTPAPRHSFAQLLLLFKN